MVWFNMCAMHQTYENVLTLRVQILYGPGGNYFFLRGIYVVYFTHHIEPLICVQPYSQLVISC